MKTLIIFLACCGLLHKEIAAQPNSVSGRVMDSSTGNPIAGATVRSATIDKQASADNEGHFSIQLTAFPDTLLISHVGYHSQRVPVKSENGHLNIFLSITEEMLEEIVVNTGYQTLRPNEVTGAVQVLSRKDLEQQVGMDVLQRIDNMAVGVRFDSKPKEPGQKLNVSVRGLSTINGPLDPLIVLDGFIYEGDIENIDPNSIDNITVLKDAAATSIWGARAGNGVIVMTTRRGGRGKLAVSFNKTTILKDKPDLYGIYQLPSADFIDVEAMLFQNGYYERQISRTPYQSLTPATEVFMRRSQGLISAADSAREIDRLKMLDGRKAYTGLFAVNPLVDQYALTLAGGSAFNSYGLNGGYTFSRNENSAQVKKINLQLTNSFRPIEKLSIDVNTYYTNSKTQSGKPGYDGLSFQGKQIPYLEFLDEDGAPIPIGRTFSPSYMAANFGAPYLSWKYYPLEDWRLSRSLGATEEIYSNARVNYQAFPFLEFNLAGQYQFQRSENERIDDIESYNARIKVNQFSVWDPTTGSVTYNVPKGGVRDVSMMKSSSYTFRGQVNVRHGWGSYMLSGILGGEARQSKRAGSAFTAYGFDDDPLTSIRTDYVNSFPTIPGNGSSSITGAPSFSQNLNRFVSLYTNWAMIFKQRYSVSMSIRRDGANVFGAKTNDKWKPFWHIGSFWDISKEAFYRLEAVPLLKLRVTYGYSGNVDLTKTPLPIGSTSSSKYTNYPAIAIKTLNDPSLRWEQVGTLNFGLDFAIGRGAIKGTVDYYIKNGTDLYGSNTYDYTVWGGQGTITKNTASMRGEGVDILVDAKNLQNTVQWDTRYMVSFNRNETVDYYSQFNRDLLSMLSSGNSITAIKGKPLNAISAYKWAGLDEEGNPQGYMEGQVSTDYSGIRSEARDSGAEEVNMIYVGSSKPQWFGSIINSLSYKAFSLSVNISFQGGYYFRRDVTSYSQLFSSGTAFPDFENRWRVPGDEDRTSVPSMVYPAITNRDGFYQMAEINVLKGHHVRLEYINLTWNPSVVWGNRSVRLQVYANLSNLGVIWAANKHDVDPEYSGTLSPPKTVAMGLRLSL